MNARRSRSTRSACGPCSTSSTRIASTSSRSRPAFHDWICASWDRDEVTIYGRFDLAYNGRSPPKLLEYNADTPTALLEAAVIQWFWMKDRFPRLDQFNSIHDRLIEAWRRVRSVYGEPLVHFAAMGQASQEDFMTVTYLRETARQAGLDTDYLDVTRIGWNERRGSFVDEHERAIRACFKLYPWEWLTREAFAPGLRRSVARWFEPAWKMLLSNKQLLVVLWELFPDCPYLLPASAERFVDGDYVRKPTLSREGANVQILRAGTVTHENDGPYDAGPFIYQRIGPVPRIDGVHPIIGSWMVNGNACGIGIREDASPITGNTSRFVPHVIDG